MNIYLVFSNKENEEYITSGYDKSKVESTILEQNQIPVCWTSISSIDNTVDLGILNNLILEKRLVPLRWNYYGE